MSIGERIIQRRSALRLTQAALGKSAGMSQQMIGKLERGESSETARLVRLAGALGVTAEWLETGNEPKHTATTETAGIEDQSNGPYLLRSPTIPFDLDLLTRAMVTASEVFTEAGRIPSTKQLAGITSLIYTKIYTGLQASAIKEEVRSVLERQGRIEPYVTGKG